MLGESLRFVDIEPFYIFGNVHYFHSLSSQMDLSSCSPRYLRNLLVASAACLCGQLVHSMKFPAEPATEALIFVDQLSVTYQPEGNQAVRALDQASLEIRPAELVGILGESGSGKSTLAATFIRLLPANARYKHGSIEFRGRNLLALPESELRRIRGAQIALIPQDPALALNPVIAVGNQIAEVLRAHMRMTRR